MKRALIVASMGILASTVWAASANAQANINPNVYPGNASEQYGGGPGPVRRGNRCVQAVDTARGYGFMKDCAAPKAATSASPRALSARAAAAPRATPRARKHKVVSR